MTAEAEQEHLGALNGAAPPPPGRCPGRVSCSGQGPGHQGVLHVPTDVIRNDQVRLGNPMATGGESGSFSQASDCHSSWGFFYVFAPRSAVCRPAAAAPAPRG